MLVDKEKKKITEISWFEFSLSTKYLKINKLDYYRVAGKRKKVCLHQRLSSTKPRQENYNYEKEKTKTFSNYNLKTEL